MSSINLNNNPLLLSINSSSILTQKLNKTQKIEFEKLILFALEITPDLYSIHLSYCNITNSFLKNIMQTLVQRSNIISLQTKSRNSNIYEYSPKKLSSHMKSKSLNMDLMESKKLFGPEIIEIEGNPISDTGMKYVLDFIESNSPNLKILKAGQQFNTISADVCERCCFAMKQNSFLLEFTFFDNDDYDEQRLKIEKYLLRNNIRYNNKAIICEIEIEKQKSILDDGIVEENEENEKYFDDETKDDLIDFENTMTPGGLPSPPPRHCVPEVMDVNDNFSIVGSAVSDTTDMDDMKASMIQTDSNLNGELNEFTTANDGENNNARNIVVVAEDDSTCSTTSSTDSSSEGNIIDL